MKWTAQWRESEEHKWGPQNCPDFEHKSQAHDWVIEQGQITGGQWRVVPVSVASRETRYNEILIALKREQEKVSMASTSACIGDSLGQSLNTSARNLNRICEQLESLNRSAA